MKRIALQYGQAIGIGHPFPETAQAIGLFLKKTLPESGISLVYASNLVPGA
ncbi:MAG: divergent polysaccharide deacetylase family protein [Deltaproteobacteria bacterium]